MTESEDRQTNLSVVAYGSLLEKEERRGLLDEGLNREIRVKVHGYKRIFNNEPDSREGKGKARGVLNVEPEEHSWFNGILIPTVSQDEYEDYKDRESGYKIQSLNPERIEVYDPSKKDTLIGLTKIVLPVGDQINNDLYPNKDYVERCLKGAAEWGSQFKYDFIETTYLPPDQPLSGYFGN